MAELQFEGWAQPHATTMAMASGVALRIDLGCVAVLVDIGIKLGRSTFSRQ
jgi:hypothetical protein